MLSFSQAAIRPHCNVKHVDVPKVREQFLAANVRQHKDLAAQILQVLMDDMMVSINFIFGNTFFLLTGILWLKNRWYA
jgi:hypothetical protein